MVTGGRPRKPDHMMDPALTGLRGRAIVCGVDRSALSVRAAALAATLADELRGHVVPTHVLPSRPAMALSAAPLAGRPVMRTAMHELDRDEPRFVFDAVAKAVDGAALETVVERGDAPERLAAVARERDALLLVVGTHSRSRPGMAVLGSVSQELVAGGAPCPVVVVGSQQFPERTAWLAPGPLVCGVNGSHAARRAADVAVGLADRMAAALTFVAVGDDAAERDATLAESAERARARGLEPECVGITGAPDAVLADAARERKAPLLILGSRGRGPVRAAVLGSVGAASVRRAPCPVVLVPPVRAATPSSEAGGV
jgi:nucleotide-binding universal stress UspA family protein